MDGDTSELVLLPGEIHRAQKFGPLTINRAVLIECVWDGRSLTWPELTSAPASPSPASPFSPEASHSDYARQPPPPLLRRAKRAVT
jgi:hypothetical protein